MRRDSFDQDQPVFIAMIQYYVWHLAMLFNRDPECGQSFFVNIGKFLVGITHIEDCASRHKERCKLVDNALDKDILTAWGEAERFSWGDFHRNAGHSSFLCISLL